MRHKFLAFVFLICILLLGLSPLSAIAAGRSDGYSVNDASGGYEVYTAEGLFEVARRINSGESSANIILCNDISISGRPWIPLGPTEWEAYHGTIEGNGHTISGLTCIEDNGEYTALIRYGTEGVTVQNLHLNQIYISGLKHAAGLIGLANGTTTVQNCFVQGVVKASDVGASGLVAQFMGPAVTIANCLLDVDASGCAFVSQCLSYECRNVSFSLPQITIRNVVTLGSCTETDGKGTIYVGGILGYSNDAEITVSDSVSLTEIVARDGSGGAIGTFRNGTMTLTDLIGSDPVFGTIYPGARGTDMTVRWVFAIGDPQAKASLFGKVNMAEATDTSLQVDGIPSTFDGNPTVPCNDRATAMETAKEILDGEFLNARLNALLETVADGHVHHVTLEAISPIYLAEEADCPTKNTYYKSCLCGEKGTETFVAGNRAMHLTDGTIHSDENGHWLVCSVCKDADAQMFPHDDSTWKNGETERTRTCRICGFTQTEPLRVESETTGEEQPPRGGCGSAIGLGLIPAILLLDVCAIARKRNDRKQP